MNETLNNADVAGLFLLLTPQQMPIKPQWSQS